MYHYFGSISSDGSPDNEDDNWLVLFYKSQIPKGYHFITY